MLVDDMIKDSIPLWDEASNLKVLIDLYQGNLSHKSFTKYIVEDTIYLFYYAKVFAYAIAKANDFEEMRFYYSMLSFVNNSEVNIREKYAINTQFDPNYPLGFKPDKITMDYVNHLLEYAINGDIKEITAAVLPCVLSYQYIFNKIKANYKKISNNYEDLVNEYLSDRYTKSCQNWIDFANKLYQNVKDEEKIKYINIFHKSSLLEIDFWRMCEE